ncbi:MAG: universal stress protein [Burkholderiales bacterium]
MYKNILIPTDGSALSRAAIVNGVQLAQAVGAKVTGFYAAPPATPIEYRGIFPVEYVAPQKHARLIEKAAAEHLGFIEKTAANAGVACKTVHVTSDFPADAIVAAARREKCDLIFIASHGRHGLSGILLGSQTQKVLAGSLIPVLVNPGLKKKS